jgi:hypothetical protein
MLPEITNVAFIVAVLADGEHVIAPLNCVKDFGEEGAEVEQVVGQWFCRLSAPGFLDATDWSGPFETEQEAQDFIREFYEVDPETGGELEP